MYVCIRARTHSVHCRLGGGSVLNADRRLVFSLFRRTSSSVSIYRQQTSSEKVTFSTSSHVMIHPDPQSKLMVLFSSINFRSALVAGRCSFVIFFRTCRGATFSSSHVTHKVLYSSIDKMGVVSSVEDMVLICGWYI